MTPHYDVVVVGAGPAGCAAAITLARAGLDVLVADKARFPRDKCCGDGLTTNALRLIEGLGADPTGAPSWQVIDEVWVRSPSGRIAELSLRGRGRGAGPGAYGAVVRRAELDASMLWSARQAGAKVSEGDSFVSLARGDDDQIDVQLSRAGEVTCRYVVAADGIWSPVRRAAGGGGDGYLGEWHAFRSYWSEVGPEAARHLWVWFDQEALPGYAWSFPLAGGRANVGVMLERRPGVRGAELRAGFEQVLASPWLRSLVGRKAHQESQTSSWPIPTAPLGAALTALEGRVLFVGDAARLADPMTGEGVGQALESGIAAGRAIAEATASRGDAGATASERYQAVLSASLLRDNKLAASMSRLLGTRFGARGAVRLTGLGVWSAAFGRWLFEDYPRAVLLTPGRWRSAATGRGPAFEQHRLSDPHQG
jgi:geranylgeranyl reductase family protein